MQIKLKWVNQNDSSSVIQVFRSTAPINTANPGTALVTLPGTASEYIDTAVVSGTTYYYAVAVSKGVNKIFTPVKVFENVVKYGPGPNTLIHGDDRLGYFGYVNQTDFVNVAQFLKLTPQQAIDYFQMRWHKFIRKGKIYFVAESPIQYVNSGYKLWPQGHRRTQGLNSGVTYNFDNSAWPDAALTNIATLGADRFHVRAPRNLPDNWNGSTPTLAMIEDPTTEFNELIQPLLNQCYLKNKIGCVRVAPLNTTPVMGSLAAAEMFGTGSLVRLMRTANQTPGSFWNQAGTFNQKKEEYTTFEVRAYQPVEPTFAPGTWDALWPILELIE